MRLNSVCFVLICSSSPFLLVAKLLYKSICPSVCLYVCLYVCLSGIDVLIQFCSLCIYIFVSRLILENYTNLVLNKYCFYQSKRSFKSFNPSIYFISVIISMIVFIHFCISICFKLNVSNNS